MFQEVVSTDSNALVKHLQEELQNYVSMLSFLILYLDALVIRIIVL